MGTRGVYCDGDGVSGDAGAMELRRQLAGACFCVRWCVSQGVGWLGGWVGGWRVDPTQLEEDNFGTQGVD
jgi:hypothetical protein